MMLFFAAPDAPAAEPLVLTPAEVRRVEKRRVARARLARLAAERLFRRLRRPPPREAAPPA